MAGPAGQVRRRPELPGLHVFVVRSNNSDTALNEAVALELLGLTGLATQEAFATRFSVNGGDQVLRLTIENPDETWDAAQLRQRRAPLQGREQGRLQLPRRRSRRLRRDLRPGDRRRRGPGPAHRVPRVHQRVRRRRPSRPSSPSTSTWTPSPSTWPSRTWSTTSTTSTGRATTPTSATTPTPTSSPCCPGTSTWPSEAWAAGWAVLAACRPGNGAARLPLQPVGMPPGPPIPPPMPPKARLWSQGTTVNCSVVGVVAQVGVVAGPVDVVEVVDQLLASPGTWRRRRRRGARASSAAKVASSDSLRNSRNSISGVRSRPRRRPPGRRPRRRPRGRRRGSCSRRCSRPCTGPRRVEVARRPTSSSGFSIAETQHLVAAVDAEARGDGLLRWPARPGRAARAPRPR